MTIPLFQPSLGDEELDAIAAVFADSWPGPGRRVKDFERAFGAYIGVDPSQLIAITSCTEGLFQAIAALQPSVTDEIILPTVSFIGAAHAIRAAGAVVRLTDVDVRTLNPRTEHIEAAITSNTKAIVVLHFGGRHQWIEEIANLAKQHNLVLIEDAACAMGGSLRRKAYGTFGDIGIWSFDAMKLLVTGDGGMLRVTDPSLKEYIDARVRLGGVKPGHEKGARDDKRWWELDPVSWGRLAFMNDLVASIGCVQLSKIDRFIERRRYIARTYDQGLGDLNWLTVSPSSDDLGIPYFYWIQMRSALRDEMAYYMREKGVYTTFRYWPLHRTSLYRDGRAYAGADLATDSTLLLPVHQNLSDDEVAHIIRSVREFRR